MKYAQAYTDGSYSWQQKVGGYGAVMLFDGKIQKFVSKSYKNTTHNRMELMAITAVVSKCPEDASIDVYSDSEYSVLMTNKVLTCIRKKQKIKKQLSSFENYDLLNKAYHIFRKIGPGRIKITWVRGHSGNAMNELTDECAKKARMKPEPVADIEFKFLKT